MDPTVRAAFILVAAVLGVQMMIVVSGVTVCAIYSDDIISGHFICDKGNRLFDLMAEVRAAALGFAGGILAKTVAPPK